MSNQQANKAGASRSTNRVVGWCLAGVVGMFVFGFAMAVSYTHLTLPTKRIV